MILHPHSDTQTDTHTHTGDHNTRSASVQRHAGNNILFVLPDTTNLAIARQVATFDSISRHSVLAAYVNLSSIMPNIYRHDPSSSIAGGLL